MDRLTIDERTALGKEARKQTPRSAHAEWESPSDRRDPVDLLEEQNDARLQFLVPIRHGRMRVSPFTFYRGADRIMAADLAHTPVSGIEAQLGGDAHLSNFGVYASPERELVFDANDFDETLQGPWEWDLKRLTTSFMIAAQHLGYSQSESRKATTQVVKSYRRAMTNFAETGYLDLWYDHITMDDARLTEEVERRELTERVNRFAKRARSKNSMQALQKLTVEVDGHYQIRSDPPVLFSLQDLPDEALPPKFEEVVTEGFDMYRSTLPDDRRVLLDRYRLVDIGLKVVGVGSVGTRCFIMLFEGRDWQDPLFIQIKEATASVLEEFLEPSPYPHHGQRVVEGQRLVQAQSDIFLGWSTGAEDRQFYVRQLRDWKGSVELEGGTANQMRFYAMVCGLTLARGHARSGDPIAISAYAGQGDTLDRALLEFAERYSEQNRADYDEFNAAIDSGRLQAADVEAG